MTSWRPGNNLQMVWNQSLKLSHAWHLFLLLLFFLRIVQNASLLLVEAVEEVDTSEFEAECLKTPGFREFMASRKGEAHSCLTFAFTFYFFFWRIV